MSIIMYGIPNCDTIKKAKKWLTEHQQNFEFFDYKKQGVPAELASWIEDHGVDVILNKRGTTYRKLSDEDKADIDNKKALALLTDNPSMIKRPIIVVNDQTYVGFKADVYQTIFIGE